MAETLERASVMQDTQPAITTSARGPAAQHASSEAQQHFQASLAGVSAGRAQYTNGAIDGLHNSNNTNGIHGALGGNNPSGIVQSGPLNGVFYATMSADAA